MRAVHLALDHRVEQVAGGVFRHLSLFDARAVALAVLLRLVSLLVAFAPVMQTRGTQHAKKER